MDKNPTQPESTCALFVRAIGTIAIVVLFIGGAIMFLSGCASTMQQGNPVFVTVTDGTEANPEPQLAVEWPESIRRWEEIVTIQVGGRVISYGPLTEEQAAEYRKALGQ